MDSIINPPFEQLGAKTGSVAQALEVGQNSAPISSHPSSPGIGSQSFPEPWKAYLLLKTTVDEGCTHPLAYMEKSKSAGFTHYQFLCYINIWFWGDPIVMYDFTNH